MLSIAFLRQLTGSREKNDDGRSGCASLVIDMQVSVLDGRWCLMRETYVDLERGICVEEVLTIIHRL